MEAVKKEIKFYHWDNLLKEVIEFHRTSIQFPPHTPIWENIPGRKS